MRQSCSCQRIQEGKEDSEKKGGAHGTASGGRKGEGEEGRNVVRGRKWLGYGRLKV